MVTSELPGRPAMYVCKNLNAVPVAYFFLYLCMYGQHFQFPTLKAEGGVYLRDFPQRIFKID